MPSPPSPPATSPSHAQHRSAPCSSTRPTTRRPRPATTRTRSPASPRPALDPRAPPTAPPTPARTTVRRGRARIEHRLRDPVAESSPMPVTADHEQIAGGIRHPRNPIPMLPRVRKRIRCSFPTTVDAEAPPSTPDAADVMRRDKRSKPSSDDTAESGLIARSAPHPYKASTNQFVRQDLPLSDPPAAGAEQAIQPRSDPMNTALSRPSIMVRVEGAQVAPNVRWSGRGSQTAVAQIIRSVTAPKRRFDDRRRDGSGDECGRTRPGDVCAVEWVVFMRAFDHWYRLARRGDRHALARSRLHGISRPPTRGDQ